MGGVDSVGVTYLYSRYSSGKDKLHEHAVQSAGQRGAGAVAADGFAE